MATPTKTQKKPEILTVVIDSEMKKQLETLADKQDLSVSQLIRRLVSTHLEANR